MPLAALDSLAQNIFFMRLEALIQQTVQDTASLVMFNKRQKVIVKGLGLGFRVRVRV